MKTIHEVLYGSGGHSATISESIPLDTTKCFPVFPDVDEYFAQNEPAGVPIVWFTLTELSVFEEKIREEERRRINPTVGWRG